LETDKAISLEHIERGRKMAASEIEYEMQQLTSTSSFQEVLHLKEGAIVMCTVNLDMDQGICNGSQGIITAMVETNHGIVPEVRFTNGIVKRIHPHYRQSEEYPTIAVGQIPLCLAWALTIHKIQGATLSMADIDVGGQIFEYGQTYVALSRVQSLDGLYLSAFQPQRIRANENVRAFYKEMPELDYTMNLPDSKVSAGNPFASYELVEEECLPSRLKVVKKSAVSDKKRPTQEVSFDLFLKENKTIEEIAIDRGLKSNTILEHILKYLPHKEVPVTRLMSEATYNEIKAAYDVAGPETPMKFIKDSLRHSISYTEIKMCNKILFGVVDECTGGTSDNNNKINNKNTDTVKIVRL
jgi:hypothetical protein